MADYSGSYGYGRYTALPGRRGDSRQTRVWRRIRASILARDGGACVYCHGLATEVHHLTPVRRGGTDAPDNLVSVCHDCHGQLL